MNYCDICKNRHTWDCEDERETGRTRCDDFELDFNAIPDETKRMVLNVLKYKEFYDSLRNKDSET